MTVVATRMTAEIVRGVTTNRVRTKKGHPGVDEIRPRRRKGRRRPITKGFYKKDGTLDGKGTVQVCVSMPGAVIDRLARAALRTQMSRAAFLRQAFKHFGADHPEPVLRVRTFTFSIPPRELRELDALAEKHGRNRSALLTHAALHFITKIFGPEGP